MVTQTQKILIMKKNELVTVWTTFPNTGRPNTLVGNFTEEEANKMWEEDTSLNWGDTYTDSDGFVQWIN